MKDYVKPEAEVTWFEENILTTQPGISGGDEEF